MIIKTDKDTIQSYMEDSSGLTGGCAESVYVPENDHEIVKFIRDASKRRISVTVSGGGTGVTGARVPFGGVVLSLEKLNKIISVNRPDDGHGPSTAVVQPCVTVKELKDKAKHHGLMYAPDPTEQTSCIGGNVATNASGSRGFKYGSTRKYVIGLKVILTTGEVLDIKRGRIFADTSNKLKVPISDGCLSIQLPDYKLPDIKNASGYYNKPGMDLIDLFIGQEGTLGIITEIEVVLNPITENIFSGVAFFPKQELSWDFALEVKKFCKGESGIDALSLEYFDSNALELLKPDYPQIPDFAKAAIFFEQDLTNRDEDKVLEEWVNLLEKYQVPQDKVWFATSPKDQESFRDFRHCLPEKVNEIIKKNGFPKVGTDIAVPDAGFYEMLQFYNQKLKDSKIKHLVFGHIGENHLHANFLPVTSEEFKKCKRIYIDFVTKSVSLGGTVSAEHGIGKLKHIFLEKMVGNQGVIQMAKLKKDLDPACILGLDNIFPKELL